MSVWGGARNAKFAGFAAGRQKASLANVYGIYYIRDLMNKKSASNIATKSSKKSCDFKLTAI
jgi:hypothetical protein